MHEFAKLLPDHKRLLVFLRNYSWALLASFFQRLKYEDQVECCTMWLCKILCTAVVSADETLLLNHEEHLVNLGVEHIKKTRIRPHTSTLVKLLRAEYETTH